MPRTRTPDFSTTMGPWGANSFGLPTADMRRAYYRSMRDQVRGRGGPEGEDETARLREANDLLQQMLRQYKLNREAQQVVDEQKGEVQAQLEQLALESIGRGDFMPRGPRRFGEVTARFGPETTRAVAGDFELGAMAPTGPAEQTTPGFLERLAFGRGWDTPPESRAMRWSDITPTTTEGRAEADFERLLPIAQEYMRLRSMYEPGRSGQVPLWMTDARERIRTREQAARETTRDELTRGRMDIRADQQEDLAGLRSDLSEDLMRERFRQQQVGGDRDRQLDMKEREILDLRRSIRDIQTGETRLTSTQRNRTLPELEARLVTATNEYEGMLRQPVTGEGRSVVLSDGSEGTIIGRSGEWKLVRKTDGTVVINGPTGKRPVGQDAIELQRMWREAQ